MRRPVAVVVCAALIWQGLGGAVLLASPQGARDDWTRVAALKPNQKVTVEPQKGRGKTQTGRFVTCDENFIILRNKKGLDLAFARGDLRRVSAVTPGRESYFALGLIAAAAGGAAIGAWQASRINRCQTISCIDDTGNDVSYYLLLGVVAGGASVIAGLGAPRRIYEVPKLPPPPPAPRGEVSPLPRQESTSQAEAPAMDTARVIAAIRQAPGSRLRLFMGAGSQPMAVSSAPSAPETRRNGQKGR